MGTKVSVITPLYEGERHIAQCIESVASQGCVDIEHIIIDNNSTDAGPEIVQTLCEEYSHLRLLHCKTPGSGPARNAGINVASGRYIAFLDADDWWAPNKLDVQISEMQKHDAVFSWTTYTVTDPEGRKIRIQQAPLQMTARRHALKLGTIGCLTAVYDQCLIGKRYMNEFGLRQDFCLWYDILATADRKGLPVVGINDPLAFYRVHSEGISSNKNKAAAMQWRAYRQHIGMGRLRASAYFASYAANGIIDRLSR